LQKKSQNHEMTHRFALASLQYLFLGSVLFAHAPRQMSHLQCHASTPAGGSTKQRKPQHGIGFENIKSTFSEAAKKGKLYSFSCKGSMQCNRKRANVSSFLLVLQEGEEEEEEGKFRELLLLKSVQAKQDPRLEQSRRG
jgi:hypothetical protein